MHRRLIGAIAALVLVGAVIGGLAWQRDRRSAAEASPSPSTDTTIETVVTTTPAAPLRVVILGDSYTQLDQWASEVADAANWDHENLALSGTGYVSTAGRSACGLDVCPNYHDRLITAAELVPDADVIVITGGVNDPTGTIVIDAVHATYSEARRLFPEATIVGFSPFGKATEYPESLVALRSIIRDEVSSVDGVYVDVGHPLADHPEWIRSDGLHPTDEGQHALAVAILAALRSRAPDLIGR
ncbi:MAG: SGNH/GDSL hydrolase family protein [Acidimicrobiales bacterium]